ncbi:F0F1 ATP synthase subunit alpha [Candidatus Bipolaricaulota bacterium]|nr:F0F1 ATP synthase subunit alpha [Candidatus Bipolaricaulota bacterium]
MVEIKSDEITGLIKEQIKSYNYSLSMEEEGVVVEAGDGIARVFGLENAMSMEILEFPGGINGLAMNLEEDNIGAILFGDVDEVEEGDKVKRTGRILETKAGPELHGRVVGPLGEPRDGKGEIHTDHTRDIEIKAPGVVKRQPVEVPLQTGYKSIDALTPIGRGQRELIIGDRRTGKSAIAIDTILNQKETDVHCFYVAVGQKTSTIAKTVDTLRKNGAMEYTTVITANAEDPTPMQYIAPYAGTAMAEYYTYQGKDAFIVYDDLSKHAVAYREISLLLRRPPGREAYPGDIFYTHSRLLERSAKLNDEMGGGSLTAFPIVETKAGDISAYIPTNVISITDGQIYLESDLFNQGFRPAINVGDSVSRVGGAAQNDAMQEIAGELRLEMAQYRDLEAFAEFASELDEESQAQLARGERVMEMLKQDQYQPMPVERQAVSLYAAVNGYIDDLEVDEVKEYEKEMHEHIETYHEDILTELKETAELTEELEEELKMALSEFDKSFKGEADGTGTGD